MTTTGIEQFDVIVIGGSPAGIAAAVTAARLGHTVALVEYHAHLGGMAASGLGKSDIENRAMIRGFFAEFVGRVRNLYVQCFGDDLEQIALCRDGYYYEPSIAETIFDGMVAECPSIKLFRSHVLERVDVANNVVRRVRIVDRVQGAVVTLLGDAFIDATYEGDLYALAGAAFRLGRNRAKNSANRTRVRYITTSRRVRSYRAVRGQPITASKPIPIDSVYPQTRPTATIWNGLRRGTIGRSICPIWRT